MGDDATGKPPKVERPGRTGKRPLQASLRREGQPETAASLEAAALSYMARYASSSAQLRRRLEARVERSCRRHGTDRAEGRAAVAALIARFEREGLLDDGRFAEQRAALLRRRGASRARVDAALAARGVGAEIATEALAREDAMAAEPELAAGLRLARRRRLGPFRNPGERAPLYLKDLGTLARAGFDQRTARRILALEGPEEALALLAEAAKPVL